MKIASSVLFLVTILSFVINIEVSVFSLWQVLESGIRLFSLFPVQTNSEFGKVFITSLKDLEIKVPQNNFPFPQYFQSVERKSFLFGSCNLIWCSNDTDFPIARHSAEAWEIQQLTQKNKVVQVIGKREVIFSGRD